MPPSQRSRKPSGLTLSKSSLTPLPSSNIENQPLRSIDNEERSLAAPPPTGIDGPSSSDKPTLASPSLSELARMYQKLQRDQAEMKTLLQEGTKALSSENRDLKARLDDQASTISSQALSIAFLEKKEREHEQVIGSLVRKDLSGGDWVLESPEVGKEKGVWVWSMEKYRVTPSPIIAAAEPPSSLDSLPVEIFQLVCNSQDSSYLPILDYSDVLSLCLVSYRLLRLVSPFIAGKEHVLLPLQAAPFIASRTSTPSSPTDRIRPLLLPQFITIDINDDGADRPLNFLEDLITRTDLRYPLSIYSLEIVYLSEYPRSEVMHTDAWAPALKLLNPTKLVLREGGQTNPEMSLPLATEIVADTLFAFARGWTGLKHVVVRDGEYIPLLGLRGERFAFSDRLRRNCLRGQAIWFGVHSRHFREEDTVVRMTFREENKIGRLVEDLVDDDTDYWFEARIHPLVPTTKMKKSLLWKFFNAHAWNGGPGGRSAGREDR